MDKPYPTDRAVEVTFDLLVDSDSFWQRLQADIAAARKRTYIQTLSFEGDRTGKMLAREVMASSAEDKRIIIDAYTKYVLSDKFRYSPKNWLDGALRQEHRETKEMTAVLQSDGTQVKFVNPMGPLLVHMPARNHKKIIVIDETVSYIGGINFSDHNFSWHDLMLRIDSAVIADFLANDFLTSWDGGHFAGRCRSDGIELLSFDGKTNATAFEAILGLIDRARSSVYVQSPYLSHPFTDRLRDAVSRGIPVTVVTPRENNKKPIKEYILWEAARSGFNLRLYRKGMTHMKAMLIDETYLIVGSCNFDYFSYRFEEETVAVVTDRGIIAEFIERIINEDDGWCDQASLLPGGFKGNLRAFQIKSIGRIMSLFNGR